MSFGPGLCRDVGSGLFFALRFIQDMLMCSAAFRQAPEFFTTLYRNQVPAG